MVKTILNCRLPIHYSSIGRRQCCLHVYILMRCNLVHKGWHHIKATGNVGTKHQSETSKKVVFNCLSATCIQYVYTKHSKSVITERQQVLLGPILANSSANLDDCRNRYKTNTKYSKSVITEEESRTYRQQSWQTSISMIAGCNKNSFPLISQNTHNNNNNNNRNRNNNK